VQLDEGGGLKGEKGIDSRLPWAGLQDNEAAPLCGAAAPPVDSRVLGARHAHLFGFTSRAITPAWGKNQLGEQLEPLFVFGGAFNFG